MAALNGAQNRGIPARGDKGDRLQDDQKTKDVRSSNILAAKAVADAIRTSLGPRGMDKMIQKADGNVIITNDGATILSQMEVFHPTAKMLVEISKSQDIEAGDGTTTVCVLAGSLLDVCSELLAKGIHPMAVAESFIAAVAKAEEVLVNMSKPVDLTDRAMLINAVDTCLSSKVVGQNSETISPLAVDAVLSIIDTETASNVDLQNVKVCKQLGGTIDDTELVHGLVFEKGVKRGAGGPTRKENAKIGLVQFCLTAPKTDMENNVVVSDYAAMDRILREERKHILGLCKKIKKAGCTVLLIQKSILRDAYNDLTLHFLAKMGILVITDIERNDVDFICRTVGCHPVAHIDSFTSEKLGTASLVEEVVMPGSGHKVVKCTGVPQEKQTATILIRGSNRLVLDEAERSIHDALCVLRSLVKKRYLIAGGGAAEAEVALKLSEWSKTLRGKAGYCVRAYAEALEVVPYTLAENAGLNSINNVTELRARHKEGVSGAGINVRDGVISDMFGLNVIQPMLVTSSALQLATECCVMILKIDDVVVVQ